MKTGKPRNTESVKPSQLKVGDTILHRGEQAEVTKIDNWRDNLHGVVYGLDLEIKGKHARASYAESGRVDLLP